MVRQILFFFWSFAGMGMLFVLIGVALLSRSVRDMYHLNLLGSEGQPARAYIFDRWTDKDSEGDITYFIAYAFNASSGQLVPHAEQYQKLYQRYQVGDTFEVRYLPNTPSILHDAGISLERREFH